MNPTFRKVLILFLDTLIGFSLVCVLPFCWLMRDGMGPDSVSSHGWEVIFKTLLTFYIGPVILILILINLAIRKQVPAAESSSKLSAGFILIIVISIVILLSYAMTFLIMR